jgi:CRISPR-associated endonuclease Csn1
MRNVLGLDVGVNSLGWALMEFKDDEESFSIKDVGVRIFPVGVKDDDFNKSGKEISKNAARRSARGIRRLYDRYKLRRKTLQKILLELNMLPDIEMNLPAPALYFLRKKALFEKIELKEIGRIFLLLNQRRGFKSNKKDKESSETEKEKSEIKKQMSELENKVEAPGFRTLGEYFYSLFEASQVKENWHNPEEPIEKIRTLFVYRRMYEREFDEIWNFQKQFYPEILDDGNYTRIKTNCIFYQRPLKSQKHLVSRCRFEPSKRVAPKSSPIFQEFRIWQDLSNLRVNNGDRINDKITPEEKRILAEELTHSKELSKAKIKSLLKLPKTADFQKNAPERLKGNSTYSKLSELFGKDKLKNFDDAYKYRLWHTLQFAEDEEWLIKHAEEKLGMDSELAAKFAEINLEQDYGNISAKAIGKILPFMKEGCDYSEACKEAGYHHSFIEEEDSLDRLLKEKIEISKEDNLRNPLVQQSVNETRRLVNDIIIKYGRPDEIRIELARELKMPKDKREELKRKNDEKQKRREEYETFLKEKKIFKDISKSDILKFELWLEMAFAESEFHKINGTIDIEEFRKFAKNVKPQDKEKYRLWLECGRISPYSGKIIGLSKLFSPEIEIDHIIPYSKSMDDSFSNKILCEREINQAKGNRTPLQYFKDNPAELYKFKHRIKHFGGTKIEKLLMEVIPEDFQNSQLNNTQYIGRVVKRQMKTVCRKVYITNGQATSILRRLWGLNPILNPDGDNFKSRSDHRHHAIDALVIANTTNRYIQLLSQCSQFNYLGRLTVSNFPLPYSKFPVEAKQKITEIFVSHKSGKRLLSLKTNKIAGGIKVQKINSVRGALHEETIYGQVFNNRTNQLEYVLRRPLSYFDDEKKLAKIADSGIKKAVLNHIENNGGMNSIKAALAKPVFMKSKDGKKHIPIYTVRTIEKEKNLIQLRPKINQKLFVSSGNNYIIAIYEKEGKRSFLTVTFFDAVRKSIKKEAVVPENYNSMPLKFSLIQGDLVVAYKEHPDEIDWSSRKYLCDNLYLIRKFNVNGGISLVKHNLSNVNPDKPKLYPEGWTINCGFNTIKAIKVKINRLGEITRYD